jgi:hypothetical protein
VAAGLTLDSGALIAAEKGERRFWALWKEALARGVSITAQAAVVAQVWRGNSPVIARLLRACEVEALTEERAKQVGRLLALSRSADVVDAAVVVGAAERRDAILTSDTGDIERLVRALGRSVAVIRI